MIRLWARERRATPLIPARRRRHALPAVQLSRDAVSHVHRWSHHTGPRTSAPARAVFVDGVYFSANLNKVPMGGWFAVAVACAVFATSELWQFGTKRKQAALNASKARRRSCQALRGAHVRLCATPLPSKPAARPGSGSRAMCIVELHRLGEPPGVPGAHGSRRSVRARPGKRSA